MQVRVKPALCDGGDVHTDAAFLLGETATMDLTSPRRTGSGDLADSAHGKRLVKKGGATLAVPSLVVKGDFRLCVRAKRLQRRPAPSLKERSRARTLWLMRFTLARGSRPTVQAGTPT